MTRKQDSKRWTGRTAGNGNAPPYPRMTGVNRGDVNRDIIARNLLIETAKAAYEQAKEAYEAIKAVPVSVAQTIKNEILEMIRAIARRNQNRLRLPVVGGRYVPLVSDRAGLPNYN